MFRGAAVALMNVVQENKTFVGQIYPEAPGSSCCHVPCLCADTWPRKTITLVLQTGEMFVILWNTVAPEGEKKKNKICL